MRSSTAGFFWSGCGGRSEIRIGNWAAGDTEVDIGAKTADFSEVNAVLLKSARFADPENRDNPLNFVPSLQGFTACVILKTSFDFYSSVCAGGAISLLDEMDSEMFDHWTSFMRICGTLSTSLGHHPTVQHLAELLK